ncbi:molecular chaperone (small heat shock protein) [Frankia casuarinae]|uniref:Heat shock protein Hsp20 n=1 Tax=Frankia casuarinae (strain DSM 45818 / CECT 9043 / HFP020203 / CcI3) TaxID=106370 RepID=Q2JAZ8_FRACC|nr:MULTISPECIES: Hsp20/alpha crystallin family protein [Frankia]ABD11544.1 heat shock protein Hsp20 [Frankia casuarinae]ETA01146.1 molecular chaperone (small heat shock protein) [Frankia sp. CcI6]EYT91593.1 molecular chaperone (small heat shock protein) [Frankia casuarinae]KDA41183.1 molecular chaperone (small heat shock protein) [Frankia sp. BMG5.23]KEZ34955.1 molecular chaperone (small heat shock protein) [Frankia sp. CeD]
MTLPVRRGEGLGTLARWDPFREIEDAWTRMGNLLGDVIGGVEGRPARLLGGMVQPVDIEETEDAFVIDLDLPGVRREDISVDLRDNELFVTGEIKERERTGVLRRRSRPVGRFEHRIAVPGDIDPESVHATLADGVLTIRLAKAKRSQPKHIEISTGPEGQGTGPEGQS